MTHKTLFNEGLTLEEAEELIKNGADVNEQDEYGKTPLFFVKNKQIVELLIRHGADIHAINYNGNTPLFYAYDIEISQLLIDYGADVNAVNINDKTRRPLDNQYLDENVDALISRGAVPGQIKTYLGFQYCFSEKQQKVFDVFISITNNDYEFSQMCLAYQNGLKNNIKMEIKDIAIQ